MGSSHSAVYVSLGGLDEFSICSVKMDSVLLRAPCIRQSPVRFCTCLDFLGVASGKCFVFRTLGSTLDAALSSVTQDFPARAPLVVVRPMMLVIMAGMNLKDSYAARRPRSLPTSAAACAWLGFRVTIFHAVFPSAVVMLMILGILVCMTRRTARRSSSFAAVACAGLVCCYVAPRVVFHDCRPSSSTMVAVHGWFCW